MGMPASDTASVTTIDSTLDDVHGTDLPAVKSVADGIETHVHSIESKVDTIDGILDDLHGTDIPDLHTDVADLHTDIADIHADVAAVDALVDSVKESRLQVLQVTTTAAANSGATTIGTITSSVTIEDVIVKMVTFHSDLTSISVTGGAGSVIDFIDTTEGGASNLGAADKQVAWSGVVELGDTKTIALTMAGTGANSVTVLTTIRYRGNTSTGAIA